MWDWTNPLIQLNLNPGRVRGILSVSASGISEALRHIGGMVGFPGVAWQPCGLATVLKNELQIPQKLWTGRPYTPL